MKERVKNNKETLRANNKERKKMKEMLKAKEKERNSIYNY